MSAAAAQSLPDPAAATARLYYVDWLRIAAVPLLIPFHTARVFNADEDWYIKNRQLSRALEVFVQLVSPWHMSLLFLLAGVVVMVCFWQGVLPWSASHPDLQDHLVDVVLRCLAVWATMVGFIGMAQRLWNKRGRLWSYSAEAAYPFYIWHQTVIVAIAYFVVQMSWPVAAKWVLLMVASLSATLLAYDLLVRRWNPVRFLFGMKPRRRGAR